MLLRPPFRCNRSGHGTAMTVPLRVSSVSPLPLAGAGYRRHAASPNSWRPRKGCKSLFVQTITGLHPKRRSEQPETHPQSLRYGPAGAAMRPRVRRDDNRERRHDSASATSAALLGVALIAEQAPEDGLR